MNYSSALVRAPTRTQPTGRCAVPPRCAARWPNAPCSPAQRVLEIGCGWGALAEEAATREFGARVTGLTLSSEQLAYAQRAPGRAGARRCRPRRPAAAGLPRRGRRPHIDAIASIEMFEAVGREYWGTYFEPLCTNCLKPGGPRLHPEHHHPRRPVRSLCAIGTDFIQQYIFPGGLLPSVSAFRAEARQAPACACVNEICASGPTTPRRCAAGDERFPGAATPRMRQLALRHAFHAHLGVLPGLLRGRLRRRQHRRRAVHAAERRLCPPMTPHAPLSRCHAVALAAGRAGCSRHARRCGVPDELSGELPGAAAAGPGRGCASWGCMCTTSGCGAATASVGCRRAGQRAPLALGNRIRAQRWWAS